MLDEDELPEVPLPPPAAVAAIAALPRTGQTGPSARPPPAVALPHLGAGAAGPSGSGTAGANKGPG
jgi:hypothetical protein